MDYRIEGNNFTKKIENSNVEELNQQVRSPAYSDILKVAISEGEVFKTRSDAVASYGGSIETKTKTTRSLWKAIGSFENFPITRIKAGQGGSGVVTLSPPLPGEIMDVEPIAKELKVQSLSFLGVPQKFSVDLKTDDMFGSDSLGTLNVENTSEDELDTVFISGFHGLDVIELGEGQRTHVREDYIAAIDDTVSFKREGTSESFKKEAFQARDTAPSILLTGPGNVYVHARSPFKYNRIIDKLEPYE